MKTVLAIFSRSADAPHSHWRTFGGYLLAATFLVIAQADAQTQKVDGAYRPTPGTGIRADLHNGLTVTGEVIRMNDTTLTLSSVNPPIELLASQSGPLTVGLSVIVVRLANGGSVTGQIVGLTERSLILRKLGALTTETIERRNVVAASPVGRTPAEAEVLLWWADIASIRNSDRESEQPDEVTPVVPSMAPRPAHPPPDTRPSVETGRHREFFWSVAPLYAVVGNHGPGGQFS